MTSAAPASGPVLLTGATGFVGMATEPALERAGWEVRATGHHHAAGEMLSIPLAPDSDWSAAVQGCTAVVHLAARTHIVAEEHADPLAAFRKVNTHGTITLARAAAHAGVRRFLFVSSVAVNGPMTSGPISETNEPRPETPYGISKLEAEAALQELAARTGMELTILRPPLVYGPNVKARFLQLLQWCHTGIPLPLASIQNMRSLIGVGNLADAIATALSHPKAADRTYLVSDDEDVSTPGLIRAIAMAMGQKPRLFPLDASILRLLAALVGRAAELERLIGSLVIDSSAIRRELSWTPPKTLALGIGETVRWYVKQSAHD